MTKEQLEDKVVKLDKILNEAIALMSEIKVEIHQQTMFEKIDHRILGMRVSDFLESYANKDSQIIRATNVLHGANCYVVADIVTLTPTEILKMRNSGYKTLNTIVSALTNVGLKLKQEN